jgi:DNA-binding HxlR family transcriptional regulator
MLAQSLQALEKDGLVLRTVYPTVPPKVDYRLTVLGEGAAECVKALGTWVGAHVGEVLDHRSRLEAKAKG